MHRSWHQAWHQALEKETRRQWFRCLLASAAACAANPWRAALSATTAPRKRQCILLWMAGGPSQIDTFDLKPQHEHGGEFTETQTSVPGLRLSEHLSGLGKRSHQLNVVRSVTAREGDHQRASYLMRTGQRTGQPLDYPAISSMLAHFLTDEQSDLPPYVSLGGPALADRRAFLPGFLGAKFGPLTINDAYEEPMGELPNPRSPFATSTSADRLSRRQQYWKTLQKDFLAKRQSAVTLNHDSVYERAFSLLSGTSAVAFEVERESPSVREAYGRSTFGQNCLLARRLIEAGVPVVEVILGSSTNWDTHADNFATVRQLSRVLDVAWSALLDDLSDRGLLETTTILWMGEFGRTPQINATAGRDHYPAVSTCVFAGGGIKTGHIVGKTSDDGVEVVDHPVTPPDILATLLDALEVPPATTIISPTGRPVKASEGTPIQEVLL